MVSELALAFQHPRYLKSQKEMLTKMMTRNLVEMMIFGSMIGLLAVVSCLCLLPYNYMLDVSFGVCRRLCLHWYSIACDSEYKGNQQ